MKIWWHKLNNWEYWPVYIVYFTTFFYWIWMMIKFKSTKFYIHSNPVIKDGGFIGDAKTEIYNLLPENTYPKTILIAQNSKDDIENILKINKLSFPLILKPNVGLRGIGVTKASTLEEIFDYQKNSNVDFLIQEQITYSNELGLFYYRFPDEKNGKIISLTLKKFFILKGNGKDTLKELMLKIPRYQIQIKKLETSTNLDEILPNDIEKCIVPFGNHNRGTTFLDGSEHITKKLENTFDEILNKIDGFYYGRLDIRYNTLEELENGINFSIIEINGAKSEPTHIYDPKHSFFYGQKEILKHQRVFYKIIKKNMLI